MPDPIIDQPTSPPVGHEPPVDSGAPLTAPVAPQVDAPDSGPPAGQPADNWQSIRDAASGLFDYKLDYEDDQTALQHLVDRAKSYEQVQRENELLRQQYEWYQQQQHRQPQQPAQPQQQQRPEWDWNPPPFNPNWLNQVEQDPQTGQLRPTNGGSMQTVMALQQFLDYRRDQMDKFWTQGPYQYIEPYVQHQIEHALNERVQQMVQNGVGQYAAQTEAQQFVSQNPWIFQQGPNGPIRSTITGEPQLSAEGQVFANALSEASQWGIPFDAQRKYAMAQVTEHRVQSGKQTPAAASDKHKTDFLAQAAGYTPSSAGSQTNLPPDAGGGAAPPPNPNMSLEDMLRQNLQAEGVTDKDLAGTY